MSDLTRRSEPDPATIVIFGASGDLAQRKLAPALHSLACSGLLARETHIVGVGRTPLTTDEFRERLGLGIEEYGRARSDATLACQWASHASRFEYLALPAEDASDYDRLADFVLRPEVAEPTGGNLLIHVATPPDATPSIVRALGESGIVRRARGWCRIMLEKPFGQDVETARELERIVHAVFAEDDVYRIDHYLGKETVQNLLAFRLANAIFEPLWRRDFVDHVQINVSEAVDVERRAATYDQVGVVRDIVQNHALQLLALIAMEPPAAPTARALRDEKVRVLEGVRPVRPEDVVLGQYAGYGQTSGLAGSRTPTFAALRIQIDNGRWNGVPFYVRTGKALARKVTEITLQFRDAPHPLFPSQVPSPNRVALRIQPDEGIQLLFQVKVPGAGMATRASDLLFSYGQAFANVSLPDAYERLLLDALLGDPSLFLRSDEIERSWEALEPILHDTRPPFRYAAGTWGPVESDRLFAGTESGWLVGCRRADETHV